MESAGPELPAAPLKDKDRPAMQPNMKEATATAEHGRRQPGRRRAIPFGVLYSTSESVIFMEDWLNDNCKGLWKLSLEEMDEEMVRKSIRVEFEHISDKRAFIEKFSPR